MPDIPSVKPAENLIALGQGMIQFGGALGNIANQINANQKAVQAAYLNAEIYSEVTQAKNYANEQTQLFNNDIYSNVNPEEYLPKWTDKTVEIENSVGKLLKHPEARKLYDEYWVSKQNAQLKGLSDLALERNIGKAEALATITITKAVEDGDVQSVLNAAVEANKMGVMSNDALKGVIQKDIPQAKFNAVYKQLAGLDYSSRIANLTQNDENGRTPEERFGLTPDQVKDMRTKIEDKHAADMKISAEQKAIADKKAYNDFIIATENPSVLMPREQVTGLMGQFVGTEFYQGVKAYRDNLDAETKRIAEHKIEAGQTQNYSRFDIAMTMWDPGVNKTPPWDPNNLGTALNNEEITEPEYNQLMTLYKQTMDEVSRGTRKGASGFKDESKIADAWGIALDISHGWSATEKLRRLNSGGFLNQGIPGDIFKQIADSVDDLERNPERKEFIAPISTFYDTQLAALQTKTGPEAAGQMKDLSYKKFVATQTMMDVFRQYPDDKNKWQMTLDKVMQGNITKDVNDKVITSLTPTNEKPTRYPAWIANIAGQGISNTMKLEVARQTDPKAFESDPSLMPEWRSKLPTIQKEQTDELKRAKVDMAGSRIVMQGNDSFYVTKKNDVYRVVAQDVGGVIRNVVYKAVSTVKDGKATITGWTQITWK